MHGFQYGERQFGTVQIGVGREQQLLVFRSPGGGQSICKILDRWRLLPDFPAAWLLDTFQDQPVPDTGGWIVPRSEKLPIDANSRTISRHLRFANRDLPDFGSRVFSQQFLKLVTLFRALRRLLAPKRKDLITVLHPICAVELLNEQIERRQI